MTFANSSETQVAFVAETGGWGITPATPALQKMRITGESLTQDIQTVTSDEIRPDAEIADLIQVGESASGDLNFELSFGPEFDTLFEHALRGAFATNVLKGATAEKSLTLEKEFTPGGVSQYFRFSGCRVGGLSINLRSQQIATGSISLTGKGGATDTAIITGATYPEPNTNEVMAASDVANITVGGTSGNIFYTDLSFSLNNNLRAQNAIGQIPSAGIGYGRREITGNMTAYFENLDLYEEFVNGSISSLTFDVSDGTNTYTFTFPRIKYTTGRVVAGGNNQDVFAEMGWQATYDATEQTSIKIQNA